MTPRVPVKPEGVREELERSFGHHGWLDSLAQGEYDGIAGWPPSWVPAPLLHDFKLVRARLLTERNALDLVRGYIAAIRGNRARIDAAGKIQQTMAAQGTEPAALFIGLDYIPAELHRDLETLLYIQDLASLGARAAIRAYLGEAAELVARGLLLCDSNRERAKRPRPRKITVEIEAALHTAPDAPAKEIIKKLTRDAIGGLTMRQLEQRISRVRRRQAQS